MNHELFRQFRLKRGDSELVCWLRDDARLKKGAVITLAEVPGEWEITKPYSTVIAREPETHWRVGGLRK